MSDRSCSDCKHCLPATERGLTPRERTANARCDLSAPPARDGKRMPLLYCLSERGSYGLCGPAGKRWEAKAVVVESSADPSDPPDPSAYACELKRQQLALQAARSRVSQGLANSSGGGVGCITGMPSDNREQRPLTKEEAAEADGWLVRPKDQASKNLGDRFWIGAGSPGEEQDRLEQEAVQAGWSHVTLEQEAARRNAGARGCPAG